MMIKLYSRPKGDHWSNERPVRLVVSNLGPEIVTPLTTIKAHCWPQSGFNILRNGGLYIIEKFNTDHFFLHKCLYRHCSFILLFLCLH